MKIVIVDDDKQAALDLKDRLLRIIRLRWLVSP